MRPQFSQLSQEGEVVCETCNYTEDDIEAECSFTEGITVDVDAGFGIGGGAGAGPEVMAGCEMAHAGGSISASWGAELSVRGVLNVLRYQS